MKKPRLERGPKPKSAIAHPQMMITSGVRHELEAGRRLSAVTAMRFLQRWGPRPGDAGRGCREELMHSHGNPKGGGAVAGQPCKIGECNLIARQARRKREPKTQLVVPALSRD